MRNLNILGLTFSLLLQGCATTSRLDPIPQDNQREEFQQGAVGIFSEKILSVGIRLDSPDIEKGSKASLLVAIVNKADTPLTIDIDNIQVTAGGKPVKVYTYNELVREMKWKKAADRFSASMEGTRRASRASSSGYTHHSGTVRTGSGSGYYTGTSYDQNSAKQAKAIAEAQTDAEIQRIEEHYAAERAALSQTILRKTTILPGKTYGAYIKFGPLGDPKEMDPVEVTVTVGGEIHRFLLKPS